MNKALDSLHTKILNNKFAEEVTETEIEALVQAKNNGWIPCSERLPSEEELVLLQTKRDGRMYVGYHRRNGAKWVCVTARNSVVTGMIPIAWQPLPQPYKEGSADNA